jgi:hypothetical protein
MNNQNQPCVDGGVTQLNQPGGGVQLSPGISGNTLTLKTLLAGSGITLNDSGSTITISGSSNTITSLGTGTAILTAGFPNATLRSVNAGTGISLSSNANTFTINNTGVVTVDNIGGQAPVSAGIVGNVLSLRSFVGTGAVNVSQTPSTINISSPVLTLTSQPGGFSLINSTFPSATLKSLIAGTGISIVDSAGTITFNNTQTPTNTVTNLGGAAQVLVDVLAGSVRARTLLSQGAALVNTVGNNITIGCRAPGNIGTGEVLYAGDIGFVNNFKSLLANGNIQIFSDPSNVYFKSVINNVIPYSGKTILNTYLSGNPELADFLSFGTNIPITSIDAFPADYPTLPTAFVGWVSPFRCRIILVNSFIKFSIPTNISEQLDIYCAIHRCKDNDVGMNLIWNDLIYSTNSNISVGDFVQRWFTPNVDVDVGWHLYFSFFAHRPNAGGSTDLIEFYTCSSMTVQSTDSL